MVTLPSDRVSSFNYATFDTTWIISKAAFGANRLTYNSQKKAIQKMHNSPPIGHKSETTKTHHNKLTWFLFGRQLLRRSARKLPHGDSTVRKIEGILFSGEKMIQNALKMTSLHSRTVAVLLSTLNGNRDILKKSGDGVTPYSVVCM